MALQSRKDELQTAWRALDRSSGNEGWLTIPIVSGTHIQVLAGRLFPGSKEALLVGFRSVRMPTQGLLPTGRGFTVTHTSLTSGADQDNWIALSREPSGSLDLFILMVDDIAGTIIDSNSLTHEQLLQLFLLRIRAWQDFMQRGKDGVLGPESELGLCGELVVLHQLINAGLPSDIVVNGWYGPLDGIQDFVIGTGAVEVKATTAYIGFPARINSLAQLDGSMLHHLFLAGVRFSVNESGKTLPNIVQEIRDFLQNEPLAYDVFERRLLHAGYFEAAASQYTRCFSYVSTRFLCVNEDFPSLTRSNVDVRIREARYEVDLDLILQAETNLTQVANKIGVI